MVKHRRPMLIPKPERDRDVNNRGRFIFGRDENSFRQNHWGISGSNVQTRLDRRAFPRPARRDGQSRGAESLVTSANSDLASGMLAPPARRKRKPLAQRRADGRRRQRDYRMRQENGLHRVELWLTDEAYMGLLRQLISTRQLTDEQALDRRRFEAALTAMIEHQGRKWGV